MVVFDPGGELTQLVSHYNQEINFETTDDLDAAILQSEHHPVAAVLVNGHSPEQTLQMVDLCRSRLFDTPIVGCVYPPYLEQLRDLGVFSYMMKPIVIDEFERLVCSAPFPLKRILIVDDDNDLCKLLVRMLAKIDESCQTKTVSSGEEALQLMPDFHPDLILLDIAMEGMDGWEVLRLKNQSSDLRHIPVIILSGQDSHIEHLSTTVMFFAFGTGLKIDKLLKSALDFSALMFKTD
jgi:CheY-like chemotaxis protein